MIDSLYLALSGMLGHERALNILGNNVTNMNTLGFRGSTVSFSDVFLGTTPNGLGAGATEQRGVGGGVDASRTTVDFQPGTPQDTGNDLDTFLQGDGFFIVQDENGAIHYTRAGRFDFVDDQLVIKGQKLKLLTRDTTGQLLPITIKDLLTNAGKATSKIALQGNFKPADTQQTIDSVDVFDSKGVKHTLQLQFTKSDTSTTGTPSPFVTWHVSVQEQGGEVGAGDLQFVGPSAEDSPLPLTLTLPGSDPIDVALDFSDVQVQDLGQDDSDVKVTSQDGFAVGEITGKTFDEQGVLKLTYSNGQSANGPTLALAQVIDQSSLVQVGDALFDYRGKEPVTIREAGDDLKVEARQLEGSNVDLTTEFSQLILMQRGYQASSQVMSTANDMLQELFDMRGRQ